MIPNGCDLDVFEPAKRPLGRNGFNAVFTGTHGAANGLDALLDAAEVLQRHGRQDIRLLLIGDGALKPRLIARAKSLGLENCTFRDPVSKVELADALARAQVGLQVLANVPGFYYGTSPNKFFDYLAGGLPVVTNYPGWIADLIVEHDCGVAVAPDDPAEFAAAIEYLADHPNEQERMGANARRLAEWKFDRRVLADRFVDFIEQTLSAASLASVSP
jgi:glycosyltransferase involved in cell wall biosynthesis